LITSASNPTLKLVRKLLARKRVREELGLFAAEGEDLVAAAAAAGIEPVELLVAGDTVDASLLAALSTLAHPAR
jgi:RNA methyltransferase, TrmH family